MRIASRMAITQFIGGQAVVLSGASVLVDPLVAVASEHPGVLALATGAGDRSEGAAGSGDVRP